MRDGVGEQEVERRAAALTGHVLDDPGQAVAADEERERLVLVRRPGHQLVQQERRCGDGDRADPDPETVVGHECARRVRSADGAGEASAVWVIGLRPASSLVDWPPDADLRVPVPERPHLRALPEDERRSGRELRDLRREPGREGAVPGGCPLTRARASTRRTTARGRARAWRRTATAVARARRATRARRRSPRRTPARATRSPLQPTEPRS